MIVTSKGPDIDEMLEEIDFSKAVRNPYVHYDKKEVVISIDKDLYEIFEKKAKEYELPTERIINRALDSYAAGIKGKVGVSAAS
ncbi:MAG: antitoxin [Oscillospiraceae bacterium]|jgi:hypothetical protein|nr:antitoxin [Oscillospiraceae bacterium]